MTIDTTFLRRCIGNRNDTAHNYGVRFAETTLALLPTFVRDARALADVIEGATDD